MKELFVPDSDGLRHVGGVGWWDAPLPWRFHICYTHTYGYVNFELVERCACGSIRINGGRRMCRNERRRAAGERQE